MRSALWVLACASALGCTRYDADGAPVCTPEWGCPAGTVCVGGMQCTIVDRGQMPRSLPREAMEASSASFGRRPGGPPPDAAQPGICPGDQVDCGGECVRTDSDPRHCGRCGVACPAAVACRSGVCCAPGDEVCAGVCVDVSNDPRHCGVCGRACLVGSRCVLGACFPDDLLL